MLNGFDFALDQAGIAATLVATRVGTWDWDVRNDRARVCAQTAALFALSPDGVANGPRLADFKRCMHPDDRAAFDRTVQDVTRRGGVFVAEYRTIPEPGNVRWVLGRGHFEVDADGTVSRGRGIVIDVTDSKLEGFSDGLAMFSEAGMLSPLDEFAKLLVESWRVMQSMEAHDRTLFEPTLRALLTMAGRRIAQLVPLQQVLAEQTRRLHS